MAALAETRDLGSFLPLPPGVRRICCIGDSITYGQGVAPRQTLAMHITRFANMAYPDQLVWVDNRGQSSGNVWHAWAPFARLAAQVPYDAAILSLCQNDAQIFESNSVRHADGEAAWLQDGDLGPILRETIADVAQGAGALGLHLLVDFYTLWDKDAPLVEAVRRECKAVGLPFIDLLHFLKHESGVSIAEFAASPFDGHPSDSGHRAAARRIVEELTTHWRPPAAGSRSVADRLVDACDRAILDGWEAIDVCDWAFSVLDAKEIVERRQRVRQSGVAFGDLAGARVEIEQRYRRWYADRSAGVQSRLLQDRQDELSTLLERAYASVRNLDEMAYVLERLPAASIAAELWALLASGGYYTEGGRLRDLPPDLKALLVRMADQALSLPVTDEGPLARSFATVRRDFEGNLRVMAAQLPEKVDPVRLGEPLVRLWQVALNLADAGWIYLRDFSRATAQAHFGRPTDPVFFTTVDVRVERDPGRPKRGGLFNLTVEADYVEPLRARRSEKLWGGADEAAYVYRFELPLLLMGAVSVGVPAWDEMHKRFLDGELRLASVEIGNFAPNGPRGEALLAWRPPPAAAPLHWVKLERLSLLGQSTRSPEDGQPSQVVDGPQAGLLDKVRGLWR